MIERVARAICTAHYETEEVKADRAKWLEAAWSSYIPLATAAIEAMRGLPEILSDIGADNSVNRYEPCAFDCGWGAVIDSILKEEDNDS